MVNCIFLVFKYGILNIFRMNIVSVRIYFFDNFKLVSLIDINIWGMWDLFIKCKRVKKVG